MQPPSSTRRRVIIVYWKGKENSCFEAFSSLRLFCELHPAYSYHTLNNYLSRRKVHFEDEYLRIERKKIIQSSVVRKTEQGPALTLERVVRKFPMHQAI